MLRCFLIILFFIVQKVIAQNPYKHFTDATEVRYDSRQPVVNYTIRIDSNDLTQYKVEMHLRNIPDTLRLAMYVHPEYDDRFYRFVESIEVKTKAGKGIISRLESTLWKLSVKGGEAVIHYSIRLPKPESYRAAWRPFLSPSGGLVGGPQSYLYVVGATLVPSYVHLVLPKNWSVITGLSSTSDPNIFFAPTINALVDAPIFAGEIKEWRFITDGVPHRAVYWPAKNAGWIDSSGLINNIQKLTEQTVKLFGRLPYREYSFLLQDSSWGGLEHSNSVTLGMEASRWKINMDGFLEEIAHEYFHTWNLMRIRPAEYTDVSFRKPPLSKGLWWSEGLTMYYADVLQRRAGLKNDSRIDHLEQLVRRYFTNSAHYQLSAERLSMGAYAPAGFLGNYNGSTHLQGEVFGNLLDFIIRNSTDGQKTIDDVMRKMMDQFSGAKGFTGKDIERIIQEVTGKSVFNFFEDHIRGNKIVDWNRYLSIMGLKADISWKDATDDNNQPLSDLRVGAYSEDENTVFLEIMEPTGIWAKAGLNSGDALLSINGIPVNGTREFYSQIRKAKINEKIVVELKRNNVLLKKTVVMVGYKQPEIKIEEIKNPSGKQIRLLSQWKDGL